VSVEREVFPELVGAGLFAFTGEGGGGYRHACQLPGGQHGVDAGGRLVDPTAVIEAGADVTESVVGAGARIAGGASIQRSVVLPGASVEAGAVFRDQVVGRDGRAVW
jgi:NDP-sugar pyrophosphorylase family protein